jgi:hypothetical protein
MPSLDTINSKLNELVRIQSESKAAAEPKEPTQEEKDEERLREIEARLSDLTDLLQQGVTRDSADERIRTARQRVDSGQGESRPLLRVYHDVGGKRISTTRRTQSKMHLADALKLRIRVGKHAQDLEHALHLLVREQVEILDRQLARVGSKDA